MSDKLNFQEAVQIANDMPNARVSRTARVPKNMSGTRCERVITVECEPPDFSKLVKIDVFVDDVEVCRTAPNVEDCFSREWTWNWGE